MRSFAHTLLFSAVLIATLLSGCGVFSGPDDPPDTTAINEDIVQIMDATDHFRTRKYVTSVWPRKHDLYTTWPLSHLRLSDSLSVEKETVFLWEGPRLYVEANRAGTRLLFVLSEYVDASAGTLYEMDPDTGEKRLLRDSTHAISSAVYLPGSDREKNVYYSYGSIPEWNERGLTPGYYLLDTNTGEDSLLVEHASPAGIEEIFNGFDVSPDGRTLLYPLQYTNIGGVTPPRIVRHDLSSGAQDTLDLSFDTQFLWLRYSPEGQKLVYGGYPMQAIGQTIAGPSAIGIVDLSTMEKRVLDTRTNPDAEESIDLFPRWSPSGRHIVYSSAEVDLPMGAIGHYSLYVLQDVN